VRLARNLVNSKASKVCGCGGTGRRTRFRFLTIGSRRDKSLCPVYRLCAGWVSQDNGPLPPNHYRTTTVPAFKIESENQTRRVDGRAPPTGPSWRTVGACARQRGRVVETRPRCRGRASAEGPMHEFIGFESASVAHPPIPWRPPIEHALSSVALRPWPRPTGATASPENPAAPLAPAGRRTPRWHSSAGAEGPIHSSAAQHGDVFAPLSLKHALRPCQLARSRGSPEPTRSETSAAPLPPARRRTPMWRSTPARSGRCVNLPAHLTESRPRRSSFPSRRTRINRCQPTEIPSGRSPTEASARSWPRSRISRKCRLKGTYLAGRTWYSQPESSVIRTFSESPVISARTRGHHARRMP